MSFKKYTTIAVCAALMILPIFIHSCKKGAEDPLISLKSRNSRVTGTWKLVSMSSKVTINFQMNVSNNVNSDRSDETYDGTFTYEYDGETVSTIEVDNETEESRRMIQGFNNDWTSRNYSYESSSTITETYTEEMTFSLYKDNSCVVSSSSGDIDGRIEEDVTEVYRYEDPFYQDLDTSYTIDSTYTRVSSSNEVTETTWFWEENSVKNKLYINIGSMLMGQVVRLTDKEMIIDVQNGTVNAISGFGPAGTRVSSEENESYDFNTWLSTHNNNDPSETEYGLITEEMESSSTVTSGRMVFEKIDKESKRE